MPRFKKTNNRPTNTTAVLVAAVVFSLGSPSLLAETEAETFDRILDRDKLICGISTGVPGFSEKDTQDNYVGFDVDFCRAVAAAMLGDDSKVEFVPLDSKERFNALTSQQIDVLFRNTTWTFTRDIDRLIDFAVINFYDGQGFLVKTDAGIDKLEDLEGKTFCVQRDTTSDKNLTDYAQERDWEVNRLYFDKPAKLTQAYLADNCDVLTTDSSALAGFRAKFDQPKAHKILPELISKEPLALAVRQGDDLMRDVVAWSAYAMIAAEELGINQQNVDEIRETSRNSAHRRLLGNAVSGNNSASLGELLSLEADWAYNIIRQVGNYGDVFKHNLGPDTAVGLERGLNALYTEGGLIYAPPLR